MASSKCLRLSASGIRASRTPASRSRSSRVPPTRLLVQNVSGCDVGGVVAHDLADRPEDRALGGLGLADRDGEELGRGVRRQAGAEEALQVVEVVRRRRRWPRAARAPRVRSAPSGS